MVIQQKMLRPITRDQLCNLLSTDSGYLIFKMFVMQSISQNIMKKCILVKYYRNTLNTLQKSSSFWVIIWVFLEDYSDYGFYFSHPEIHLVLYIIFSSNRIFMKYSIFSVIISYLLLKIILWIFKLWILDDLFLEWTNFFLALSRFIRFCWLALYLILIYCIFFCSYFFAFCFNCFNRWCFFLRKNSQNLWAMK